MTATTRPSQRFLAPEVVQTSTMDCGPATLKCLLEGFGVAASYGRLREACQTDAAGTSIDTQEPDVVKEEALRRRARHAVLAKSVHRRAASQVRDLAPEEQIGKLRHDQRVPGRSESAVVVQPYVS